MAKRLDQVLVIDIEATCWDTRPPWDQISEIIEIGICVVDVKSLQRRERRSILVKPQRSQVSEFCTQLTTITPELVADGVTLGEAVRMLATDYDCSTRLWASWGDYDRNQFHRNCKDYSLEYPFGPTHLNIKNLFSVALGLPRELGIDAACEHAGLEMEGTHHRGGDDAWNIAGLFCWLLKQTRGTSPA
jgi:inhibitor of KinA sporulation pathway (predicted exonuclease)